MPDLKLYPDESPENPLARIGFFDELNSPNIPAYTLPRVAGSSGQVITIDANGDCNFQSVGSIGTLGSIEFRVIPYYDSVNAAADDWDPVGKTITPEVIFNLSLISYSATKANNTWRYDESTGLTFSGGTEDTGVSKPSLGFATHTDGNTNPNVTGNFIYTDAGGTDNTFSFRIDWILIQEGAAGSDGAAGNSARGVILTASDQSIEYNKDGTTPDPTSVTVFAEAVNASESSDVYFEFFIDDVSQGAPTAAGNDSPFAAQITITSPTTIGSPKKVECQIREGGASNPILARDQIVIFPLKQGSDAITIILSNEAHTLPTTNSGTVTYTDSGTDIEVYEGTNQLSYDDSAPYDNSTFRVSTSATNITVGTASTVGNVRSFGDHSNMTADSASIEYTITVKNDEGVERTFTKKQSLAKSIQGGEGADGTDGRTVTLSAGDQLFDYDTNGANPTGKNSGNNTTVITAEARNTSATLYYEFFVDDSSVKGPGTSNTYNYTAQADIADMPDKIEVEVREGINSPPFIVARDQFTIFGLQPGSSAITIAMSNEAHSIRTGPLGDSPSASYPGSGTTFDVFEGNVQLDYDDTVPYEVGTYRISADISPTSDITIGSASTAANGKTRIIGDHSNMVNGDDQIVYEVTVKRADGTETTFTRTQTLNKSERGEDGEDGNDAKTVRLTADDYVIEYDQSGKNPTPASTITLTATAQNFVDPYFKFTGDGITDETVYTDGTGDSDTFSFSVPADYSSTPKTIRVGVAEASADTVEIAFDSTTIASVKEGSGNIGVFLSNDSHVFPANSSGAVSSYSGSGTRIEVYEGATELDYDGVGTSNGTFTVSASGTNITPGSISEYDSPPVNSPEGYKALVADHNGVNDGIDTSTIVYTISGTRGNGDAFSVTKNQTFSKSKSGINGTDGTDAAAVKLIADTYIIPYATDGNESPETEVGFTTEIQSITNPYYEFYVNKHDGSGDVEKQAISTTSTFTLADADEPAIGKSVTVKVKVYEGNSPIAEGPVAIDSVSIYAVQGGSDAVIGFLTNAAHVVTADSSGTVSSFTGAGGTYKVFVGNTDVTTSCTFSVLSETGVDVSIGESTGVDSPLGTSTGVYTVSSMSANQGTATFQAVIPAATAGASSDVTLTADYSISKSIEGTEGGSTNIVFQRASSKPSTPANSSGVPSGWYDSPPAGTDILWAVNGTKAVGASTFTWGTVFQVEGTAVAEVAIYIKASSVSTPTGGSYNFTTNTLTAPTSWSTSVPTLSTDGDKIYLSVGLFTGSPEQTAATTTWSTPVIYAQRTDGANGRTVTLSAGDQLFNYNTNGSNPTPSSTTVTATARNTTAGQTVYYEFLVDGSSVQGPGTGNTYTYTPQADITNMPDKIECEIREGSVSGTIVARDQFTIFGLQPGSSAITIAMSNESHSIRTGPLGDSPSDSYPGSGTNFRVFEGSTQLNYDDSAPFTAPSYRITASASDITIGTATTTGGNTRVFADHSDMINNDEQIDFSITVKRADGTEETFTRTQSLSKSLTGASGDPGVDGKQNASGLVYYTVASASDPGAPSATSYNFSTRSFSNDLTSNWQTTPVEVIISDTTTKYWSSRYDVTETTAGGGTGTPSFADPTGSINFGSNIQSDNYVAGTSGWQIQRDTGDAEFNNVTARGSLKGGKDGPRDYINYNSPLDSPEPHSETLTTLNTGFYIGPDDSPAGSGSYDFIIGDSTNQLRFDGSSGELDIRGAKFTVGSNEQQVTIASNEIFFGKGTSANSNLVIDYDSSGNKHRITVANTELSSGGVFPTDADASLIEPGRILQQEFNSLVPLSYNLGELEGGILKTSNYVGGSLDYYTYGYDGFKHYNTSNTLLWSLTDSGVSTDNAKFSGGLQIMGAIIDSTGDDGTSGYVPTADGSGGWEWLAQTGGGGGGISGSGTTGTMPIWTGSTPSTALGDSNISFSSDNMTISASDTTAMLHTLENTDTTASSNLTFRLSAGTTDVDFITTRNNSSTTNGYFELKGTANAGAGAIYSFDSHTFRSSGGSTYATIDSAGDFAVDTNTLYVDASANSVGIGVTSPQANLDVGGSATSDICLQLRSGDAAGSIDSTQIVFAYNGGSYNSSGYAHSIRTRHNGGAEDGNAIDFWLWDYGTDTSSTLGSKRVMTIEGTGRVGIGTDDPSYKLDINDDEAVGAGLRVTGGGTAGPLATFTRDVSAGTSGTITINSDANRPQIRFTSSTDNWSIGLNGTQFEISDASAIGASQRFHITTAGIPRFYANRIDISDNSDQNLGVGFAAMDALTSGIHNTGAGIYALSGVTSGSNNTAFGYQAGIDITTQSSNTLMGRYAGANTIGNSNTFMGMSAGLGVNTSSTGTSNVGIGQYSLVSYTTGAANTAVGTDSLFNLTTGSNNVAIGNDALYNETVASGLTAIGYKALEANASAGHVTQGTLNTGVGYEVLKDSAIGYYNTGIGYQALQSVDAGYSNVAVGLQALRFDSSGTTSGYENVGVGFQTGYSLTTGYRNTIVGHMSGFSMTTAYENVAIGYDSGGDITDGFRNVTVGTQAGRILTTGDYNTLIGRAAGYDLTTASNNTAVGASAGENMTSDGNVYVGSSSGLNATSGVNTAVGYQTLEQCTTGSLNTAIGYRALDTLTTASNHTAVGTYAGLGSNPSSSSGNVWVGYDAGNGPVGTCTGVGNVGIGAQAMTSHTTANAVTCIGYQSGLYLETANDSVGIGRNALEGEAARLVTGASNVAIGPYAQRRAYTGVGNISMGRSALHGPSGTGTTGNYNVSLGYESGFDVSSGSYNVMTGYRAGYNITSGVTNVAIGTEAIFAATSGNGNVAVGRQALYDLTDGLNNVAIGQDAAHETTTGDYNVAVGYQALYDNVTGGQKTAVGYQALQNDTGASFSVAVGYQALGGQTTGLYNVAIGHSAGGSVATSNDNVFIGTTTGIATTSASNTMVGFQAGYTNTTGASNTMVGHQAGYDQTTGANNLLLGRSAGRSSSPGGTVTTQSNRIVLGDNSISNAYIKVSWTVGSDERDKSDIEDLSFGLDFVNKLRPVTYRWDERSDYFTSDNEDLKNIVPDGTHKKEKLNVGLIAQEVEEIEKEFGYSTNKNNRLFVDKNEDGTKMGMSYERLVPVLVNAIKELSAEVEKLKSQLNQS